MQNYLLLLRDIHLGKSNRVLMPVLRQEMTDIALKEVLTYIGTEKRYNYRLTWGIKKERIKNILSKL